MVMGFISGSSSNYSEISALYEKRVSDLELVVGKEGDPGGSGLQPSHLFNNT